MAYKWGVDPNYLLTGMVLQVSKKRFGSVFLNHQLNERWIQNQDPYPRIIFSSLMKHVDFPSIFGTFFSVWPFSNKYNSKQFNLQHKSMRHFWNFGSSRGCFWQKFRLFPDFFAN